ncbi:MAG: hypothetical protein IKH58_11825 [Bacteroidales bacterium]|nr:hypothetical protein [Bacteroidales bacterium]
MKKFFTISALVATSFGFASNATADVVTYDFSEFEEQVILADANYTYQYRELTLVGNDTEGYEKDYVSASARFHCNGTSSDKRRYISFTPETNGTLTVSFRSNNNSATDRITAVGTAVVTGADMEALLADEQVVAAGFTDGSTEQTISAPLLAGTTYYAYFANGGQSILSLTWTPVEQGPTGYGFEGEGTEESPYILKSADDFATLAANINAENTGAGEFFQLAGDIDFAGAQLPMIALGGITNVNKVEYAFEGVIDGAGYTISGVKHDQPNKADAYSSYVGLVSALGENGVIKNLTIEGEVSGNLYVAPFAGLSAGLVENCVNNAPVSNTGAYGAGIVGSLIRGTGVVRDCENNGTVTSNGGSYACGIVGGSQRHTSIEAYNYVIANCDNNADITSSGVGAAGIVGSGGGLITDCNNYGNVTAGGQYAGGIMACSNNEAVTFKRCINFAVVTGVSKVAGIAGELRNEASLLDGCYNIAEVEDGVVSGGGIVGTDADESKVKNVGGLIGNSTKEGATVKHSASITSVTVPATVETAGHLAGTADIVLEDCYYFAPDAVLPLDNETMAIADPLGINNKWSNSYEGNVVVNVMGQEIVFEDKLITVNLFTSDEATIEIPEISYQGFVIDEFDVNVPYTATEEGCTFAGGEYTTQAGDFAIQGTSFEGTMTETDLAFTTTFSVGGMPIPMTVTFNGKNDSTQTIIEVVDTQKAKATERFDLQGRRSQGEAGLFIENGKIFFVR